MYKISVPFILNKARTKEEILQKLQLAKADYVFLCPGGSPSAINEKNETYLNALKEAVPFFKHNGYKVGAWIWSFSRNDVLEAGLKDEVMVKCNGEHRYSVTTGNNGVEKNSGFVCPSSEKFRESSLDLIKAIAKCNPDIILFDDDYGFSTYMNGIGCFCNNHLKLISQKLGYEVTHEEVRRQVMADKPNEIRKMWYELSGETLENYAEEVRKAVDSINPDIRVGICSVMSTWGIDGTNSEKISKKLAGKTKPFLRLIGAPYWGAINAWNNKLPNVIELARMQYSYITDNNVEVFTEGDVYPRPRHMIPASYLEIFDTALRAAGVGDGIHKYMFDYTSNTEYEPGYITRHINNEKIYEEIESVFGNKTATGVRVYEFMNKVEEADFTGIDDAEQYVSNSFFSIASRMLSDNSIPTIYCGNDGVGIVFGENARNLPKEAFDNSLILDIRAAKILIEQGIDVGIEDIGEPTTNPYLYFTKYNDTTVSDYCGKSAYQIKVKYGAEIITYNTDRRDKILYNTDGQDKIPDAIHYKNEKGQKFLVYCFDAAFVGQKRYRNYYIQKQIIDSIEWLSGKKPTATCIGNPDLYVICKENNDSVAIGLWNIFADSVLKPIIKLNRQYSKAKFINCSGKLNGDVIELSTINAFDFCFIELEK